DGTATISTATNLHRFDRRRDSHRACAIATVGAQLAVSTLAPAPDFAAAFQSTSMAVAGTDLDDIGKIHDTHRLTAATVKAITELAIRTFPPAPDVAIFS